MKVFCSVRRTIAFGFSRAEVLHVTDRKVSNHIIIHGVYMGTGT